MTQNWNEDKNLPTYPVHFLVLIGVYTKDGYIINTKNLLTSKGDYNMSFAENVQLSYLIRDTQSTSTPVTVWFNDL